MNLYYWLARTMLIERLLGVTVYAGLLLIVCFVVGSAKNYATLRRALNIYLLLLCVMAFFYIPGEQADLFRWRILSAGWKQMTFTAFFNQYLTKITTPVAYLMIYLCGKTGVEGVLPAVCALIFFGNTFYILKDLYRKHTLSAQSISISLLFLMAGGGFLEVISGIRCFVSLAILARCFYDEIYNRKSILKTFGWEVIAALIHSMALVLLVGRLCFLVIQKKRRLGEVLISAAVAAVSMIVIFTYGTSYVVAALNKGVDYVTGSEVYSYIWERLIGIIMVVLCMIVLRKVRRTLNRMPERIELKNMQFFNTALIAVELILAVEYNMFHRMVMFSTLTMLPMVAEMTNDRHNRSLSQMIKVISLAVLVLACARGNLSGYKFVMLT